MSTSALTNELSTSNADIGRLRAVDWLFGALGGCSMIAQWSEHCCAKPEALGLIPSCDAWIVPSSVPISVLSFFFPGVYIGKSLCIYMYIFSWRKKGVSINLKLKNPRRARVRAETRACGTDSPSRSKQRAPSITPSHHPQKCDCWHGYFVGFWSVIPRDCNTAYEWNLRIVSQQFFVTS